MTTLRDAAGAPVPVVTERELKGWLAGYLWTALGVWGIAMVGVVVWAVRLEARVDQTSRRVEEVRMEGSLPLQALRRDLDSTRFVVQQLLAELRRERAR
jgi:hypothetical protein